jgi:hypothetical protein
MSCLMCEMGPGVRDGSLCTVKKIIIISSAESTLLKIFCGTAKINFMNLNVVLFDIYDKIIGNNATQVLQNA